MKIDIEDVKRLEVREGDVLWITLPEGATSVHAEAAVKELNPIFEPKGVDIVFAGHGTEVMTVRRSCGEGEASGSR